MTEEPKLPLHQDNDYISSYADGFFVKLDQQTGTVRLVFYKKEVKVLNGSQTNLPDDFLRNLMFEVRLPNSALNGLLDIAARFNQYREELNNEDLMNDQQVYDSFLRFSEKLASSTFDTSDPQEHDKDLNAKFYYYLAKRQAKEVEGDEDKQSS